MIDSAVTQHSSSDATLHGYPNASTSSVESSLKSADEITFKIQRSMNFTHIREKGHPGFDRFACPTAPDPWKLPGIGCFDQTPDEQRGRNQGSRETTHRHLRRWETTLLRVGPLSGILSMFIAIACIFACLGVLASSNQAAVTSWLVQPSEYLAILTAIANLAMRYACVQGVVIAWWTRALRGSTLSQLHWDWRSGHTLIGALTSGRQMGLIGLACILSTLVAIDGPLLQRATHVVSAPIVGQTVRLNVTMAAEIPQYYTGEWMPSQEMGRGLHWDFQFNKTIPTANGSAPNMIYADTKDKLSPYISRKWLTDEPLVDVMRGCHGLCRGKLIAPALAPTSCETHLLPVNYSVPVSQKDLDKIQSESGAIAPPLDRQAFMIASSLVEGANETFNLVTGFTTKNACVSDLNYTTCTLQSAVGEYDVTIKNGKVTLDSPAHPTIIDLANNTRTDHKEMRGGLFRSTLAAVAASVYERWDSFAANYFFGGKSTAFVINSGIAALYLREQANTCHTYTDPHEEVLASINKLMVYIGAEAAKTKGTDSDYLKTHMDPGWPINTTATADVVGEHNIYRTDYRFFAAAVILEIACILLVVPTYWGWWRLGRPCSFSPLEVAKVSPRSFD